MKKRMCRGFKVLSYEVGTFVSAIHRHRAFHGVAVRTYAPGRIVRPAPECGPLAVFGRLKDAVFFCFTNSDILRNPHIATCGYEPYRNKRHALWDDRFEVKSILPDGTRLANAIVINKPVAWHRENLDEMKLKMKPGRKRSNG